MSAGHIIVPLRPGSDGDATHRPTSQTYTQVDPPTLYLEKIGLQWMKSRKEALPGLTYALERLPAGYTMWQRPRVKDPSHVDKYLYGHPNRIYFDSPNRFFPHFKFLMENGGNAIGCPCTVCNAKGGAIPPLRPAYGSNQRNGVSGAATPKVRASSHKGRPKLVTPGMDTSRNDEEGTPDVYRNLIDKLQRLGNVDETITEPMSLDWRAEQEILPRTLKELKENPQWLPRRGDIVLYVRELPPGVEICRITKFNEFKLVDVKSRTYVGHPLWEAGLIGQTPTETTDIDDLVEETKKEKNVSYSGVRVEPIPSPNSADKSLSKRYRYIPVHYTRPFVFWKDFLGSLPEESWHPTIKNALAVMSSFSLMGKHRFRGTWPEAQIYSHGIYIGSETLVVGDTVRLIPKSGISSCTDILTITSIRLKFTNLDVANSNDYDEGRPYNSSVHIFGKAYTSDAHRSSKEWRSFDHPVPNIIRKSDPWCHPLHPPSKEMQVPFSRILGRLFESDAMTLWFPPPSADVTIPPNLSQGLAGLQEARAYSRGNDRRITESFGATWFWGDSRAEALDLRTVNGLEISKFDSERDPKEWRKQIKAAEKMSDQVQTQIQTRKEEVVRGGFVHKGLRGFAAHGSAFATASQQQQQQQANSSPRNQSEGHSTSASATGAASSVSASASASGNPSMHFRKRGKVIDLSSEGEDEIRQQTRIIEERVVKGETGPEKKKAKVMVVID